MDTIKTDSSNFSLKALQGLTVTINHENESAWFATPEQVNIAMKALSTETITISHDVICDIMTLNDMDVNLSESDDLRRIHPNLDGLTLAGFLAADLEARLHSLRAEFTAAGFNTQSSNPIFWY